jgi:hypothetical protein
MNGKKSFVLYADLKTLLDQLPDEVAGRLFKMVLDYVNDLDPTTEELVLKVAFEPIKQQLKRDLKNWTNVREKRSMAGQISAATRQMLTNVPECTTELTVNENVTVNGNVDVIDWSKMLELYNLTFGKKTRIIPEAVKRKYRARLKEGYTKVDIVNAMKNAKRDQYHRENGYKYCTLEFFSRPDKLDRFINQGPGPSGSDGSKYVPTV